MTKCAHAFRAIPGAGWRCTKCLKWTVSPPPKEQTAAYQAQQRARRKGDR